MTFLNGWILTELRDKFSVILQGQIFTIPDEEISAIDPVCTFLDGRELHSPNPLKA